MPKYLPGNPTAIVQNMPGGGNVVATNHMYNNALKDGTVIAVINDAIPLHQVIDGRGVRFDADKFNWLGSPGDRNSVTFAWHTSGIRTIEDVMQREVVLGGTGVASSIVIYPTVMNKVLGTKFKIVLGYKGSGESMLAVERGEVEGHSTSWTAVKVGHPDWRPEKKINIIVQFALKKHPELPDVPTVVELARNDEERQILRAVMNATEIGTAFFTTPGVPADRVTALRRAFDATVKDPEFLADAQRTKLTVGPLAGEELQKLVTEVSDLPPALLEKVRAAYGAKTN
jgi:tripartite-type tricarboxylate transporter receptor subunit TctC